MFPKPGEDIIDSYSVSLHVPACLSGALGGLLTLSGPDKKLL